MSPPQTAVEHTPNVRLVLLALGMGGFAIGATEFAAMGILPWFAAGLGVDEPTAGHVISAYALGVVIGAPILAVLGARMSRRILLILLMAMFALTNGLSALAPTYEWMLAFRFLSGVPHGAYFGVAALVAASVAPKGRRAQAVSRILLGLTIATIVGVPFATLVSQAFGWRWTFVIVSALAVTTMTLVYFLVPRDPPRPEASPLRELDALRRRQVWLTLGIGAIGFGGMFAVYAYFSATLLAVTGVSEHVVPLMLAVFGMGMTAGNIGWGWAADKLGFKAAAVLLAWSAFTLAIYPFATGHLWSMAILAFMVGLGGGLGTILQTRLMDVAGDAQTLAAALNHSAFNVANALGPFLAGAAVASGYGWSVTGWVGCALSVGGLILWTATWLDQKRTESRQSACSAA